jgi:cyclase
MKGYDIELIRMVRNKINTPLTVLGGAGNLNHIQDLIREFGIIGSAAGSLFVFKGIYRAVLINYPPPDTKDALVKEALEEK